MAKTAIAEVQRPADGGSAADIARRLSSERRELFEACDHLLGRMNAGDHLAANEVGIFSHVGWTETDVERQRARIGRVRKWQTAAGTKDDLTRDERALDAADKKLQSEGPKIEAEIEALAARLRRRQDAKSKASRHVFERKRARDLLCADEMLPQHVLEEVRRLHGVFRKSVGGALARARSRTDTLNLVLAWEWDDGSDFRKTVQLHAESLRMQGLDYPGRFVLNEQTRAESFEVTADELTTYQAKLAEERIELAAEIEELEQQAEPTSAEVTQLKRYYLDGPGRA